MYIKLPGNKVKKKGSFMCFPESRAPKLQALKKISISSVRRPVHISYKKTQYLLIGIPHFWTGIPGNLIQNGISWETKIKNGIKVKQKYTSILFFIWILEQKRSPTAYIEVCRLDVIFKRKYRPPGKYQIQKSWIFCFSKVSGWGKLQE